MVNYSERQQRLAEELRVQALKNLGRWPESRDENGRERERRRRWPWSRRSR